jgi:CRISPR-associated protein Cas1
VAYLHEFIGCQTKQSLVYDFQEPYRWIVDTTVISCLESDDFGRTDFYRMDNYVLRLGPEAARKLIDALRMKFNSPVRYKGRYYSWDTLIRLKAQELANYVLGRRAGLCFDEPRPALGRADSETVRDLILSLTTAQARRQGIGKGTLHVLRKHAASENSFKVYTKVSTRLRCHPAWSQYRSG